MPKKKNPRVVPRHVVCLKISDETRIHLRYLVQAYGTSAAAVIRDLIDEHAEVVRENGGVVPERETA
jgi:hypothetical protein